LTDSMVEDAVQLLTDRQRPAILNEYGSVIVGGFRVTDGVEGSARIAHATPEPDLLDPERPSGDEVTEARHRMVNAYANTLEEAGWTVHRRGSSSRKPYLLAWH